jgi:hypothetical protein
MQMSCQSANKNAADATAMRKGAHAGIAGIAGSQFNAIAPGVRPLAPSAFNLSALALEHLGVPQQQQQLLQLQIQQQLLQQEAACRVLFGSSPSIAGVQSMQPGIPPVSMHSLPQHHDNIYSQLLAAHLRQGDYNVGNMNVTNGGNSQIFFPFEDAGATREATDIGAPSQGLGTDEGASQPSLPPLP